MKDIRTLCNANIPNSLHSLLEASILDVDDALNKQFDFKLLLKQKLLMSIML